MTSIYVALIIYLVILFAVGIYYSKKNATISDFLLAGKSLGVIAATLTISASLFGGGLLTGTAQKAYNSGPMMYVYGIFGSGFGLLLASFLVKKMKDFSNFGTITEYLETRYNSKFLRSASAFLSMVALIALVGSQVGAAVGIMNALGMKNTTIAALFACIVIIALTSMGGLMAVDRRFSDYTSYGWRCLDYCSGAGRYWRTFGPECIVNGYSERTSRRV